MSTPTTTPLTDQQLIDEGRGYSAIIGAAFCRKIEVRMHVAEAELAAERARLDWMLIYEAADSMHPFDRFTRSKVNTMIKAEAETEAMPAEPPNHYGRCRCCGKGYWISDPTTGGTICNRCLETAPF